MPVVGEKRSVLMMTSVGLDVSKATLDAVLLLGELTCHRQVSNDEKGWC